MLDTILNIWDTGVKKRKENHTVQSLDSEKGKKKTY